jgi:hypothetical protein
MARFDVYLQQLGKTALSLRQLQQLSDQPITTDINEERTPNHLPSINKHGPLVVVPNHFPIFVYEMSQLSHQDTKHQWLSELLQFLQLPAHPNVVLGHANENKVVTTGTGTAGGSTTTTTNRRRINSAADSSLPSQHPYPEMINICDDEYQSIRWQLIQDGQRAADYILTDFIESKHVTVGQRPIFAAAVTAWAKDPCV